MKFRFLLALCLLLAVPSGLADDSPDGYTMANTPGGIGGGGLVYWYVGYPTDVVATGTYSISISTSSTIAGAPVLAFVAGSGITNGCTLGTFAADPVFGSAATAVQPVTTTAAHCSGSFRLTFTLAGAATSEIRVGFAINTRCGTTSASACQNDNLQRQCNASTQGTACVTPNSNVDSTTRLCNASALGTSCTTPNVNVHQDQACGSTTPCQTDTLSRQCVASNLTTDCTPSHFEARYGMTATEFAILIGFTFMVLFFWFRSQDWFLNYFLGLILMFIGLVWVFAWLPTHNSILFLFTLTTFMFGIYVLIRNALDRLALRKGQMP